MKQIFLILLISCCTLSLIAQKEADTTAAETESHGFKKEYLFTGGAINLSFFNGVTVLGASPQLGYSLTHWLDAGILFGYTYSSQRDNFNNKLRQTIIGPGAFVRIFPVDFLFISTQFEHNFIRVKYIPVGGISEVNKVNISSLLLGAGYTSGRQGRNSPYYYFSVSVDILNKLNSPYTDQYKNVLPVIKAGFNIPLFQGSRRR